MDLSEAKRISGKEFGSKPAGHCNEVARTRVPLIVTHYGVPQYAVVPISDAAKIERGRQARKRAKETGVLR